MSKWLAIAAYRCEVAGVASDSIDIQVRFFELSSQIAVESALQNEPASVYLNPDGEAVEWNLAQILSIEEFREPLNGDELIGFITGAQEFVKWTKPRA